MQLLVVGGGRVFEFLVRRVVPEELVVETAQTFDEALRRLLRSPPHAAIVNLGPADVPWAELQRRCHDHSPPIPVLYESSVYQTPEDAGLEVLDSQSRFLRMPCHVGDLRQEIDRLMELAVPHTPASERSQGEVSRQTEG